MSTAGFHDKCSRKRLAKVHNARESDSSSASSSSSSSEEEENEHKTKDNSTRKQKKGRKGKTDRSIAPTVVTVPAYPPNLAQRTSIGAATDMQAAYTFQQAQQQPGHMWNPRNLPALPAVTSYDAYYDGSSNQHWQQQQQQQQWDGYGDPYGQTSAAGGTYGDGGTYNSGGTYTDGAPYNNAGAYNNAGTGT